MTTGGGGGGAAAVVAGHRLVVVFGLKYLLVLVVVDVAVDGGGVDDERGRVVAARRGVELGGGERGAEVANGRALLHVVEPLALGVAYYLTLLLLDARLLQQLAPPHLVAHHLSLGRSLLFVLFFC